MSDQAAGMCGQGTDIFLAEAAAPDMPERSAHPGDQPEKCDPVPSSATWKKMATPQLLQVKWP
jgi:hypothetical protein